MSSANTELAVVAPVASAYNQTEGPIEYVDDKGNVIEYDINKRLFFCDVKEEPIPSAPGVKPMVGYRINIQDRLPNGQLQDLIFQTEELFSFGPSESNDKDGNLNGYSLPLCMWNQEGATPSQKYFSDLLEYKILEKVKEHLVSVRTSIKKADLEIRDLRNMYIFYRKKDENGARNMNDAPVWYPKLITSKKKGYKILTRFYQLDAVDEEGNLIELDPYKLMGQNGKAKACVKVESIYIGTQISVQCKVWEADYKVAQNALPRKAKVNHNAVTVSTKDNSALAALMMSHNVPAPQTTEPTGENKEVTAGGDITTTDPPTSLAVVPAAQAPVAKPAVGPPKVRVVRTVAAKKA